MNKYWLLGVIVATGAASLGLQACGDDETVRETPDASFDGPSLVDSGPGPGTDASDGAAVDSGVTSFTVPASGGSIDVQGAAMKLTFTFPASAGGKTVTFKQGSAASIGLATGQLVEAISMGPDGTRFTEPVIVKPEKRNLVGAVLSFAESGGRGPASPMPFNATAGGFELRHFTALVIVPPGKVCDSEGFNDNPSSARCNDAGTATTFRQITCKGYSFCIIAQGSCCVDPAVDSGTGCAADQQLYATSYAPTDSNGGANPWCEVDAGDWTGGDAGCGGSGLNYGFGAGGGCSVSRTCSSNFAMSCDGTTCTCTTNAGSTGTFAQAASCDNGANMRSAFVQGCNYPVR
jgi:hypothetical protein